MKLQELSVELVEYLNEKGIYHSFIAWMEERGYSEKEIEACMEENSL